MAKNNLFALFTTYEDSKTNICTVKQELLANEILIVRTYVIDIRKEILRKIRNCLYRNKNVTFIWNEFK